MSDTREALTYLLADHRFLRHTSREGDVCYCGWRDQDEPHGRHQADVLEAEFLVVPRSDIVGYEYGWRYTHPHGVRTYRAEDRADAIEDARYQRRLELHERQPVTGEALERPVLPWSPIPLPEDGQR